jgi:hypothetical protein
MAWDLMKSGLPRPRRKGHLPRPGNGRESSPSNPALEDDAVPRPDRGFGLPLDGVERLGRHPMCRICSRARNCCFQPATNLQ